MLWQSKFIFPVYLCACVFVCGECAYFLSAKKKTEAQTDFVSGNFCHSNIFFFTVCISLNLIVCFRSCCFFAPSLTHDKNKRSIQKFAMKYLFWTKKKKQNDKRIRTQSWHQQMDRTQKKNVVTIIVVLWIEWG